jgi:hypothetical protein
VHLPFLPEKMSLRGVFDDFERMMEKKGERLSGAD